MEPIPKSHVSSSFKKGPEECASLAGSQAQWTQWFKNDVKYGNETGNATVCTIQFPIPNNIGPPVLFYYRLTNFYQNHRRYVKSLDTDQLKGTAVPTHTIKDGSCDPLQVDDNGKPYYPCGLIANSLFNDTFTAPVNINPAGGNAANVTYNMTNKGIAWDSDKALYGQTKYDLSEIAVPPNWIERYPSKVYHENNPPPNLNEDEEFQVWMRTAGLPTFSKLALRNDKETMKCANYKVDILMSE